MNLEVHFRKCACQMLETTPNPGIFGVVLRATCYM